MRSVSGTGRGLGSPARTQILTLWARLVEDFKQIRMDRLILVLIIISAIYWEANSQTMNDSLTNATILIAQRRSNEAETILNSLIKHKKIKNDVLMYRCQAYYQMGDYNKAFEDANEMLKDSKALTENQKYNAYWNASVSLVIQNKFAESLEYAVKAQKLKSKELKTNQTLALVYMNLSRFDESMKYIKVCRKISPTHFGNYKLLGQLHLMKGELNDALLNYDKSISLNPNYGPAYENRATVKLKLDDKEGACSDLNKALSLGLTHLTSFIDEICNH